MPEILNHLWQSTLFAPILAAAAGALRDSHAKARYSLWFAASLKFLIPFAFLLSLGTRVGTPLPAPPIPALTVERVTTSFAPVRGTALPFR